MMVKFQGYDCYIVVSSYRNRNIKLDLWHHEEGPMATVTVNGGQILSRDQAYIKDYSENTGMLQALMDAGIVTRVIEVGRLGYANVPLCALDLEKLMKCTDKGGETCE